MLPLISSEALELPPITQQSPAMTSTASIPPPSTETPQSTPQGTQPSIGGSRGRGNSRGVQRGRGGARGRGNRGSRGGGPNQPPTQQQSRQTLQPPPGLPAPHTGPPRPPPDDLGGGVSSQGQTRDAVPGGAEAAGKAAVQEEEPEGEVCFICASPIQHHSIAPCNHRTCHICALRLRTLYKTRACAHCRVRNKTRHLDAADQTDGSKIPHLYRRSDQAI